MSWFQSDYRIKEQPITVNNECITGCILNLVNKNLLQIHSYAASVLKPILLETLENDFSFKRKCKTDFFFRYVSDNIKINGFITSFFILVLFIQCS